MKYLVSFRSSLNICNYTCWYCPWAGTFEKRNKEKVQQDAQQIERILHRFKALSEHRFSLFFVPRAEMLILSHYQSAVAHLSQFPHVEEITVQTNLSMSISWIFQKVDYSKLRLWITYHPDQLNEFQRRQFLQKIKTLQKKQILLSVGAVGIKGHLPAIVRLREELSPEIYLWVNGYKRETNYYNKEELELLCQIDPYFNTHFRRYASYGKPCRSGEESFFLDEFGQMKRCNFTQERIGNFFEEDWEHAFQPRTCPLKECSCYQGLMHIPELAFEKIYGSLVPARIPLNFS